MHLQDNLLRDTPTHTLAIKKKFLDVFKGVWRIYRCYSKWMAQVERHDIASLKCGFTSRRRTKMSKKEWTEEVWVISKEIQIRIRALQKEIEHCSAKIGF